MSSRVKMMDKLIYLAGPISKPNPMHNVHDAVQVARYLMDAGYTPYIPHLSVLQDAICPTPYEYWMAYDFRVIANCGLLVRLPGESEGADREVIEANRLGIPVCVVPHVSYYEMADRIIFRCEMMDKDGER